MSKRSKIIVIPIYNEEKRLKFKRFEDFSLSLEGKDTLIVFANDGSSDNTLKLLEEFAKNKSSFIVHDYKKNEGKAEVIRKSFIQCISDYDFKSISFLDADLATDIYECNEIMNLINENKIMAFGSRISKIDNLISRSFIRHILGRFFCTIVYLLFKLNTYDSQCGCKCFKRSAAKEVFNSKFISNWIFDIEIFLRLQNNGHNLKESTLEIPLKKWVDVSGSKISLFDVFFIWIDLFRIYRFYR
tara:strand:+ start:15178 stop:15909 length:732 start_codon:yes stop_codon:yes gene_type:complete